MDRLKVLILLAALVPPALLRAQVMALRAGHLVDPETGNASANQIILIDGNRFSAIGAGVAIPSGAQW